MSVSASIAVQWDPSLLQESVAEIPNAPYHRKRYWILCSLFVQNGGLRQEWPQRLFELFDFEREAVETPVQKQPTADVKSKKGLCDNETVKVISSIVKCVLRDTIHNVSEHEYWLLLHNRVLRWGTEHTAANLTSDCGLIWGNEEGNGPKKTQLWSYTRGGGGRRVLKEENETTGVR